METKLIGHVGVDSGQLLLCDPCYIDSQWEKEDFEDGHRAKHNFSYAACCEATLSEEEYGELKYLMGHPGVGVAFSTAFGDGLYPVLAHYLPDGTLKSVEVIFQEEEESE